MFKNRQLFVFGAMILLLQTLLLESCDDPVPGRIGGIVLVVRSLEATADADIRAIKSIEIQTRRVEIEHAATIGAETKFIPIDTAQRIITIANNIQTDRLIAQYQIPVGYVYQIRIFPESVIVHLKSGADVPLNLPGPNLPSWEQSGWKIEPIDGNPWSITQDQLTGVRALFVFDKLLNYNHGIGYKIKPTISAESFAVNPPNEDPGVYADQIAVVFKRGTTEAQISAMNSEFGSTIAIAPRLSTVYRMKIPSSKTLDDAFNYYSSNSLVQAVLPAVNYSMTCSPSWGVLPAQSLSRSDGAWARLCSSGTVGSYQVRVAVIDTGIDLLHPDLWLNIGIAQGEIPVTVKMQYNDCDGGGILSLYDLNYCKQNQSLLSSLPSDYNKNGFVDALDIIHLNNPWRNGIDDDGSGKTDDFIGWNFADDNADPSDPLEGSQHGTLVAGVLAAMGSTAASPQGLGHGLAGTIWRVSIIPIRINNRNPIPTADEVRHFDALNYAENLHVDVVNISQAHNFSSESAKLDCAIIDSSLTKGMPVDKLAFARANYIQAFHMLPWYDESANKVLSKTLYIGGAGNNALDLSGLDIRSYPNQGLKDALGKNVMLVGAIQAPTPLICRNSNFGSAIDIWAPGSGWTSLLTADGDIRSNAVCGTSLAGPIVAGTAALILAKSKSLRGLPASVRDHLVNNASVPPVGGALFLSPCENDGRIPPSTSSLTMLDTEACVR